MGFRQNEHKGKPPCRCRKGSGDEALLLEDDMPKTNSGAVGHLTRDGNRAIDARNQRDYWRCTGILSLDPTSANDLWTPSPERSKTAANEGLAFGVIRELVAEYD